MLAGVAGLGRRRHRARAPPRRARPARRPSAPPTTPERERERLDAALARRARGDRARPRGASPARAGDAEAAIFDAHLAAARRRGAARPGPRGDRGGRRPPSARGTTPPSRSPTLYRGARRPATCASARPTSLDVGAPRRRRASPASGAAGPAGAGHRRSPTSSRPAEAAGLDPRARARDRHRPRRAPPRTRRSSPARSGIPAVVGPRRRACSRSPRARRCCSTATPGRCWSTRRADELRRRARRAASARAARRAAARERAREPGAHARRRARRGRRQPRARPPRRPTAVELGAEGVGLLRTEFLFLDRAQLPDEDEQAETLREIAARARRPAARRAHARRRRRQAAAGPAHAARGQPVPGRARHPPGARSARSSSRTQLRAILRVAAEHPVKAMFPMVATLGELRAARALLDEARGRHGDRRAARGRDHGRGPRRRAARPAQLAPRGRLLLGRAPTT